MGEHQNQSKGCMKARARHHLCNSVTELIVEAFSFQIRALSLEVVAFGFRTSEPFSVTAEVDFYPTPCEEPASHFIRFGGEAVVEHTV